MAARLLSHHQSLSSPTHPRPPPRRSPWAETNRTGIFRWLNKIGYVMKVVKAESKFKSWHLRLFRNHNEPTSEATKMAIKYPSESPRCQIFIQIFKFIIDGCRCRRKGPFVSYWVFGVSDLRLAQVRLQLQQDALQRLDRQVAQLCNYFGVFYSQT